MKVMLTNPITGETTISSASLTTDHPLCRYGQPVMLVDNDPIDIANCMLQGLIIIDKPTNKAQMIMLEHWLANAQAILTQYINHN